MDYESLPKLIHSVFTTSDYLGVSLKARFEINTGTNTLCVSLSGTYKKKLVRRTMKYNFEKLSGKELIDALLNDIGKYERQLEHS